MSETLHSTSSRSDEKLLMFELLHSIAMKLNALTIVWLSKLHLMSMSLDALTIVWLSNYCIRSWNDQMHVDDCLLTRTKWCWLCVENMMSGLLHLIVIQSNARWQLSIAKIRCSQLTATSFAMKCRDFAFDAEIVECIDNFVCFFEKLKINDCLSTQTKRLMFIDVAD